jgi:diaminobutyrate-2-oxoglutarate transaminase
VPLLTLDITTPVKDRFVDDLLSSLPENFARNAKIQFCSPSGADGIEAAIKLVKIATGKRGIIAFQGSYHGMTHGALSVTGMVKNKENIQGLMPDVVFLPYPYDYRCPFGLGGEMGEQVNLHYMESLLKDPCSGLPPIAGVLVEVVQGEGGCIPASDSWMRGLREITLKYDIPLIVDEVQTGIGRTGNMFAFERSGIVPDVIVVSKAIGGALPLSLIVYHNKYDKWPQGAHVGTFRGNQLAMAAGSAVLNVIREEQLINNANIVGDYMLSECMHLQTRFPFIGDVRGRGLMVAAEIVNTKAEPDSRGKYPVRAQLALAIQYECFRRGVIIELGGREDSTVRFLPPLTITLEQAGEIMNIFKESLTACAKMNL